MEHSKLRQSPYESYTDCQMNTLLEDFSNWTFVKTDGYENKPNGQRCLMVIIRCICGNEQRKMLSRVLENRYFSCGCLIKRRSGIIESSVKIDELWMDIKGYEQYYQVSNLGRIKRKERKVLAKDGSTMRINKESILCPNRRIYLFAGLNKDRVQTSFPIHRLVATHFIPNPENKPTVNHKDGNKHNNHVDNLEWCTQSENIQHAYDTGLTPKRKGRIISPEAREKMSKSKKGKAPWNKGKKQPKPYTFQPPYHTKNKTNYI